MSLIRTDWGVSHFHPPHSRRFDVDSSNDSGSPWPPRRCGTDRFLLTGDMNDGAAAARASRECGFAVTEMHGRGRESAVVILNLLVPRKQVSDVMRIVQPYEPKAFVTVEKVRSTHGVYVRPGGRKFPYLVGA